MKYCRNCGNELADEMTICPKCGSVQQTAPAQAYSVPVKKAASSKATLALVFGCISLLFTIISFFVLGWLSIVGLILSAIYLGIAIVDTKNNGGNGVNITAIVICAFTVILSIVAVILWVWAIYIMLMLL